MCSEGERSEKILYVHQNPVARGLVAEPGGWEWSSYRHYATGERGVVEIESEWTAARRELAWLETQVSEARPGFPHYFRSALRARSGYCKEKNAS